jgi:P27 family predicted phage terminase small subunit
MNKQAKELWVKVAPELQERGDLTEATSEALAILCKSWADYLEMTATLDEEGKIITSPTGVSKPHPAAALQKSFSEIFARQAEALGLTPKSKSKAKISSIDDSLDAYFPGVK